MESPTSDFFKLKQDSENFFLCYFERMKIKKKRGRPHEASTEIIVFNGLSFYRRPHSKKLDKRNYFYCNDNGKTKLLHREIWKAHYGSPVPKGFVLHHKDHNPSNNDISNLECMSRKEHAAHHFDVARMHEKHNAFLNTKEGKAHMKTAWEHMMSKRDVWKKTEHTHRCVICLSVFKRVGYKSLKCCSPKCWNARSRKLAKDKHVR